MSAKIDLAVVLKNRFLFFFVLEGFSSLPFALSFGQLIKRVRYASISWDAFSPVGMRGFFHGKLSHFLACLSEGLCSS